MPLANRTVYRPQGAAKELWKSKAPEILLEGPAGTGKSRGLLEKILALSVKYQGSRHLLCRKTRASMTQSILVTFEEKVLPPDSPIRLGPQRQQRQEYKIGDSRIVVGGLDNPERTFSTEYDTVSLFEAIEATENDWESLHRALRNNMMGEPRYHQATAECNPGSAMHWLNLRAKKNKMLRLRSKHEDNPELWDKEKDDWTPHGAQYIKRLDQLTGVRRLRLRLGQWASVEGAVYPTFDFATHVIKPFVIPLDWRRIRVIDWGFTNPLVCQWWAMDWDNRMYMYREIYHTQKLVQDHAERITMLSRAERFEQTVADHDAEDAATAARYGVYTVPAYKEIESGIEAIKQRLRVQQDGKARLYLFQDCLDQKDPELVEDKLPTCTWEEFENYRYPDRSDKGVQKEDPIDRDNHGMDAMRYAVAYVDGLPHGELQEQEGDEVGAIGGVKS